MILALIAEVFLSLIRVSVVFLSSLGIGLLIRGQRSVPNLWQFFFAIVVGFLILSQLHYYALAFSIYSYSWFQFFKLITMIWAAIIVVRSDFKSFWKNLLSHSWILKLSLIVYSLIMGLFLLTNSTSLLIHGDAMQYHLAFPWSMSLSQSLFMDSSFLGTGIYQGFDYLYLYVTDLASLETNYVHLLDLKIFSVLAGLLLPISTYYLSRFMGARKILSIMASLSLLTVSSIVYWGTLKNDVVTAGLVLFFVAAFIRAWSSEKEEDFYWASALAGFSISTKLTNIILCFFLAVLIGFRRKISLRTKIYGSLIVAIIVMPWAWLAYTTQGHPLHPAIINMSPSLELAWEQRNANGLVLSLKNWFIFLPQLLLNRYPVSGNQSLGIPFFLAFVWGCMCLGRAIVKFKLSVVDAIFLAGLLWFLFFSTSRFEGRFLSRYILNFVGISFAYAFTSVDFWLSSKRVDEWMPILLFPLLLGLTTLAGFTDFAKAQLEGLKIFSQTSHTRLSLYRQEQFNEITNLGLRTVVSELRGDGTVAVNDAFILLIPPPFYNVHGLHFYQLNLYEKDGDYLKRILSNKEVSVLVIRQGISGITPALLEFIEDCSELTEVVDGREVYKVKHRCKAP